LALSQENFMPDRDIRRPIPVARLAIVIIVLSAVVAGADVLVQGFNDAAIQAAVHQAAAGDTVRLPAGDYVFTGTVTVDRPLVLVGAGRLLDVGIIEPGEPNEPPRWGSAPSVCRTDDDDLTLFEVAGDGVTFRHLKLVGAVTHTEGTSIGIRISGHDALTVADCELTRFRIAVGWSNSVRGVVTGSYVHENYRDGFGYGVSVTGPTMATGGSEVTISHNEFTYNRHAIASNSPATRFVVADNYFHDNDLSQWQASVDTHPQGGYALRAVIRDNHFERTRPMAFSSGSLEITGNYFDAGCGDYSLGGYSRMVDLADPYHNGNFVPQAILHDIYLSDNVNHSSPRRRLLWVDDYELDGQAQFVAYNLFVNGRLFTRNSNLNPAPRHPYPGSDPRPFVGHMYATLPGTEDRVDTLKAGAWYDLHVLAVDPEGAEDIAEIGAQLVRRSTLGKRASERLQRSTFAHRDNYHLRATPDSAFSRELESSPQWRDVSKVRGAFLDGAVTSWRSSGSHRVHLTTRIRVSDRAVRGVWHLYGHARDRDGNLPISAWHEHLEGWPIFVESDVMTSIMEAHPGPGVTPAKPGLGPNYPNPFNPVTTITFALRESQAIDLAIYNMDGQRVATVRHGPAPAGRHAVTWDGSGLASGVYLCRLTGQGDLAQTRKMILVK
jgi:hypothetical protein